MRHAAQNLVLPRLKRRQQKIHALDNQLSHDTSGSYRETK